MKDNRQNREAKEYLEKTEVDKVFQLRLQDKNLWTDVEVQTAEWLKADIDKLPVTEAEAVKYGEWVDNTYKYVDELDAYFIQAKCTCCNRYNDRIDIYSSYMSNKRCSHCGAYMRNGISK